MEHGRGSDENMPRRPFRTSRHRLPDSRNDCDDKTSDDFDSSMIGFGCICGHVHNGRSFNDFKYEETLDKDRLAKMYLINEDRLARMYLKEIESRNKWLFSKLPSSKTRGVSSDEQDIGTDYPILVTAFILIAVTSLLAALDKETWRLSLTGWMHGFMAGFFLLFGFVKLMDLRAFAQTFARYDFVAALVPFYGLLYPFLEIGVAWLYIFIPHSRTLNTFCLAWMLLGAAGALHGLLQRRGVPLACACMGSRIRLPLSWITVAEYLLMALMTLPVLLS